MLVSKKPKSSLLPLHWQHRFIQECRNISQWSKDRSTKQGSLIVHPQHRTILATGYNGFTDGMDDNDPTLHERPLKYTYCEHAERNALYNCCRYGVATEGCVMFVTGWSCPDCARGIIRSGISALYIDGASVGGDFDTRWKPVTQHSNVMFRKAGVKIIVVDSPSDGG